MSKYILKKKLISIGDMFCKITFHKLFFCLQATCLFVWISPIQLRLV